MNPEAGKLCVEGGLWVGEFDMEKFTAAREGLWDVVADLRRLNAHFKSPEMNPGLSTEMCWLWGLAHQAATQMDLATRKLMAISGEEPR